MQYIAWSRSVCLVALLGLFGGVIRFVWYTGSPVRLDTTLTMHCHMKYSHHQTSDHYPHQMDSCCMKMKLTPFCEMEIL